MIRIGNVLTFLCPDVNWVARGETYDDIDWCGEKPAITKKQFEDGFAEYDAWKAKQDADKATAKSALLERLGITEDEAKLLLS
jgi:hypothetical protein